MTFQIGDFVIAQHSIDAQYYGQIVEIYDDKYVIKILDKNRGLLENHTYPFILEELSPFREEEMMDYL